MRSKDLYFQFLFDEGHLLCREVVVENSHGNVAVGFDIGFYFFKFAFADIRRGVGAVHALKESLHGRSSGCVGQESQFVDIFAGFLLGLFGSDKADKHGAFLSGYYIFSFHIILTIRNQILIQI